MGNDSWHPWWCGTELNSEGDILECPHASHGWDERQRFEREMRATADAQHAERQRAEREQNAR